MVSSTVLSINYIVKTPGVLGGDPRIAGRRIGVHDVVILHIHLGEPLLEIAESYDLSMAEVHAALAYYYDHLDEIESIIAEHDAAEARFKPSDEAIAELRAEVEAKHPDRMARIRALELADPYREMSPPEIAAEFGVSEQAVRKAASEGWIPARKAGKVWLIRRRDAAARWGKGK